jgi:hypothetical protein
MSKDSQLLDVIEKNNLPEFKQLMAKRIEEMGSDALNKELCDSKKDLDDDYGLTPFACAAKYDAIEICQYLLEQEADPGLPTSSNLEGCAFENCTPLEIACFWGALEGVQFLLGDQCGVRYGVSATQEALALALQSCEGEIEDRKNIIKLLLQKGANFWRPVDDTGTNVFQKWADGEYAIGNILVLDQVMVERDQPIDYHRQIAFRKDNNQIVHALPFLAHLFLSIKKCEPGDEKIEILMTAIETMLVTKQLSPTVSIKYGEYRGLSPLDILAGMIMRREGRPATLNVIVEQILSVRPELLSHPIRRDNQDDNSVLFIDYLRIGGAPYRETLLVYAAEAKNDLEMPDTRKRCSDKTDREDEPKVSRTEVEAVTRLGIIASASRGVMPVPATASQAEPHVIPHNQI